MDTVGLGTNIEKDKDINAFQSSKMKLYFSTYIIVLK
jgi:hypothetical protein